MDNCVKKRISNGEKLKSLNNEKLAEYLCTEGWTMGDVEECLKWLEQPAEDSFWPVI